MRATDLISVSLMMMRLLITDADAASKRAHARAPTAAKNTVGH